MRRLPMGQVGGEAITGWPSRVFVAAMPQLNAQVGGVGRHPSAGRMSVGGSVWPADAGSRPEAAFKGSRRHISLNRLSGESRRAWEVRAVRTTEGLPLSNSAPSERFFSTLSR